MEAQLSVPDNAGAPSKLSVTGAIDRDTLAHDFWQTLQQQSKDALIASKCLEIDLLKVERADTAGLAWLLNIIKDLHQVQVDVRFCNIPAKLTNLAALSSAETLLVKAS